MAQLYFNAEEVEPANFGPLPEGKYQAMVSASEMKPTKMNDGAYLELELTVIDGPYANRKVWARLNLENPSQAAVRIARQQLSALCRAAGVMAINDSAGLHNRPILICVVLKPRGDGNGLANEIKSYEPMACGLGHGACGTAPTPATEAVPQTPSLKSQTSGPAPWGRPA